MKALAINGSPRPRGNTEILLNMFLMSGAIVPGSTYWNLGFGLDKGDVAKDDEASRNMQDLGQTIAWLGAAIHQHAASRPPAAGGE
ncbi:MAG: hypothetical protein ABSC18_15935 [Verrucomicrobiota bacterium]|jgi:multimeric flavodoxin WrbA